MSASTARLLLFYSPHDHLLAEVYLGELEVSGVEYEVVVRLGEELHLDFEGYTYRPELAEVGRDDGILLAIRAASRERVPDPAIEEETRSKISATMKLRWSERRAAMIV